MNTLFETKSLLFRELTMDDLESTHSYGKRPEICTYQTIEPHSIEDIKAFLENVLKQQNESPRKIYDLAVIEKKTNTHFAGAGLRIKPGSANDASIGYSLHPDFWNKGYGTEVSLGFIEFGFNMLNLNRIWGHVHIENYASIRVLEKSGFKKEGTLKEGMLVSGEYVDCHLYGIVKSDYLKSNS